MKKTVQKQAPMPTFTFSEGDEGAWFSEGAKNEWQINSRHPASLPKSLQERGFDLVINDPNSHKQRFVNWFATKGEAITVAKRLERAGITWGDSSSKYGYKIYDKAKNPAIKPKPYKTKAKSVPAKPTTARRKK